MKLKIDIMNASWRDYVRMFTAPNPSFVLLLNL